MARKILCDEPASTLFDPGGGSISTMGVLGKPSAEFHSFPHQYKAFLRGFVQRRVGRRRRRTAHCWISFPIQWAGGLLLLPVLDDCRRYTPTQGLGTDTTGFTLTVLPPRLDPKVAWRAVAGCVAPSSRKCRNPSSQTQSGTEMSKGVGQRFPIVPLGTTEAAFQKRC